MLGDVADVMIAVEPLDTEDIVQRDRSLVRVVCHGAADNATATWAEADAAPAVAHEVFEIKDGQLSAYNNPEVGNEWWLLHAVLPSEGAKSPKLGRLIELPLFIISQIYKNVNGEAV